MMKEDKINFEILVRNIQPSKYLCNTEIDFKIIKEYFGKCFDDLTTKMQNKEGKLNGGITQTMFSGYINLPKIVSDRIFEAFQMNHDKGNNFLSKISFVKGMINLYFGSLKNLEILTFKIFDVDNKNVITKENVLLLMTYLNNSSINKISNFEEILDNFFENKFSLNFWDYKVLIEKLNSNVFVIFLLFIYSLQPFTDHVIKFYMKFCLNDKNFKNSEVNQIKQEFVCLPNKEIIQLIINYDNLINSTKRKNNSKNKLNFAHLEEAPKLYANTNDEFTFEDISNSDNLKESKDTTNTSIENTNKFENELFYEQVGYELSMSNNGTSLIKSKIVLVDNNLFSFKFSPFFNQFILRKVLPLSGCFFTKCEKITFHNNTFYPFAILSQYGNTMANISNVFLCLNEKDLDETINNLNNQMNFRNINEEYLIMEIIGSGTFSTVKLGINNKTGEKVAIKIINKNNLSQQQFEMIKYEIDIMNFLRKSPHPDIITPLDIFEDKFSIFYVMEFMSGGTLKSHLKENGKLPEESVREVISQIAHALKYLDQMGIIHRDIKADNILLKNSNDLSNVKLSDFGLSTIKFQNQIARGSCGTLLYSAPELLYGIEYDNKVDVWSLGVLTYYLFTECFPFYSNQLTKRELKVKIVTSQYTYPENLNNEISEEIKIFIEICLSKNNLRRYDIKKLMSSKFLQ